MEGTNPAALPPRGWQTAFRGSGASRHVHLTKDQAKTLFGHGLSQTTSSRDIRLPRRVEVLGPKELSQGGRPGTGSGRRDR